ncbi:MAG: hypothetical protein M3Q09_00030 [Gemmatimonadota bacterium]|nr:hypothetical protein [Gemmatimonadota bacterium]
MKRLAFVLSFAAAAALASPLAAQNNDGPWWDPGRNGSTSGRVDDRNGTIYDNRGVYRDGNRNRADGQWHTDSRDRNGNMIYVRRRVNSNGDLVIERARRDRNGRFTIINRRVVDHNVRNDRVRSDRSDRRDDDRWEDRDRDGRNDRWEQNGGHDNGRHNGKYKVKKNKR